MRKIKIETEKYYHIYNRGAGKLDVFCDEKDYLNFLRKIRELNNESLSNGRDFLLRKISDEFGFVKEMEPGSRYLEPGSISTQHLIFNKYFNELREYPKLVDILCYSLQPNHYHFILKQLTDNGIEKFMHKLGTSYVNYFNKKYKKSGVLFQGRFKAFPINNENKLCQLSAYVNCNYEIHKLGKAEKYKFSSYKEYLNLRNGNLCNKKIILELFKNNLEKYKEYCEFVIKDSQDIKKWKKMYEE